MPPIKNSDLLRKILEVSSQACSIHDVHGNRIVGNENLMQMLESSSIDYNHSITLKSTDEALTWSKVKEGLTLDQSKDLVVSIRQKPGATFNLHIGLFEQEEQNYYLLVFTDVSHITRIEERAQHQSTILDRVINEFPAMIMAWDAQGKVQVWNEESERVTGYLKGDMINHDDGVALLFPNPLYFAELKSQWETSEDDVIHRWETEINCKDGSRKHISCVVRFTETPLIEGINIWVIACEITEELNLQLDLAKSNERFEAISQASNDAIWDWDLVNDVLWWSDGITNIFGYNKDEIKTNVEWWVEKLHPAFRDSVYEGIKNSIDRGRPEWSDEYLFKRQNGTYAYVLDKGRIEFNEEGKPVRMIGGMIDLSALKEFERQAKSKDSQLKEMIDFNSTRVRAPLARMLSLSRALFEMQHDNREVKDLVDQLFLSAFELDRAFKRLNERLEQ